MLIIYTEPKKRRVCNKLKGLYNLLVREEKRQSRYIKAREEYDWCNDVTITTYKLV